MTLCTEHVIITDYGVVQICTQSQRMRLLESDYALKNTAQLVNTKVSL